MSSPKASQRKLEEALQILEVSADLLAGDLNCSQRVQTVAARVQQAQARASTAVDELAASTREQRRREESAARSSQMARLGLKLMDAPAQIKKSLLSMGSSTARARVAPTDDTVGGAGRRAKGARGCCQRLLRAFKRGPPPGPASQRRASTVHSRLSPVQQKAVRQAFGAMDFENHGKLAATELRGVFNLLGMKISIQEVHELVHEYLFEQGVNHDAQGDEEHEHCLSCEQLLSALSHSDIDLGTVKLTANLATMGNMDVDSKGAVVIGHSPYMISPHGTFHMWWDMFITGLLMLTLVVMPISLAFDDINDRLFILNLTVDIFFLIDVIKQFNTGWADEKEHTVLMERASVARLYIRSWFFVDFTSSIPTDAIMRATTADANDAALGRSSKLIKMLRLLRLAKLLKLLRVSKLFTYAREFATYLEDEFHIVFSESTAKLARLGFLVLIIAHWMGCINFMVCRLYGTLSPTPEDPDNWLYPEDSWVYLSGLHSQPEGTQYKWSLFKALCLMLMLGFEAPPPMNSQCGGSPDQFLSDWCEVESWLTLVCLAVGSVIYAVLIANVSSIVHSMQMARQQYQDKVALVTDYMRSKHLPAVMRTKVLDFYRKQFSEGKLFDEHSILAELEEHSPELMREIAQFNARNIVHLVPLLRDAPNRFQERLSRLLTPSLFNTGDTIIDQGEHPDKVYFIESGEVEVLHRAPGSDADNGVSVIVGTMKQGCYFGDAGLLFKAAHPECVRCKTDCVLYRAKNDEMEKLLDDFPAIRENMLCVAGKPAPLLRQAAGPQSRRKGSMLAMGITGAVHATHKLRSTLQRVRVSPHKVGTRHGVPFGAANGAQSAPPATSVTPTKDGTRSVDNEPVDDGCRPPRLDHEGVERDVSHVVSSPASHAEVKRAMALKMAALSAFGNSVKIVKTPKKPGGGGSGSGGNMRDNGSAWS